MLVTYHQHGANQRTVRGGVPAPLPPMLHAYQHRVGEIREGSGGDRRSRTPHRPLNLRPFGGPFALLSTSHTGPSAIGGRYNGTARPSQCTVSPNSPRGLEVPLDGRLPCLFRLVEGSSARCGHLSPHECGSRDEPDDDVPEHLREPPPSRSASCPAAGYDDPRRGFAEQRGDVTQSGVTDATPGISASEPRPRTDAALGQRHREASTPTVRRRANHPVAPLRSGRGARRASRPRRARAARRESGHASLSGIRCRQVVACVAKHDDKIARGLECTADDRIPSSISPTTPSNRCREHPAAAVRCRG